MFSLAVTDESGVTCVAADTFTLGMYTTGEDVDHDRDGDVNKNMADEYDSAASNDEIDSPTNLGVFTNGGSSPDAVVEGNVHRDGDVDWYYFQVPSGEDTESSRNVAFDVDLDISAACDAGAGGVFELRVMAARDTALDGVYRESDDGSPVDPTSLDDVGSAMTLVDCSDPVVTLAYNGADRTPGDIFRWLGVEYVGAWESGVCTTDPTAAAPEAMYTLTITD